jgi:hypothetical protein
MIVGVGVSGIITTLNVEVGVAAGMEEQAAASNIKGTYKYLR